MTEAEEPPPGEGAVVPEEDALCFPLAPGPPRAGVEAPDPSSRNRISQKSLSTTTPPPDDEGREPDEGEAASAAAPVGVVAPRAAARPGELRQAPPRGSSLSEALLFIDALTVEEETSSSSFFPPGKKCVGKLLASEINVSARRERDRNAEGK